jgi:hypothetical protein
LLSLAGNSVLTDRTVVSFNFTAADFSLGLVLRSIKLRVPHASQGSNDPGATFSVHAVDTVPWPRTRAMTQDAIE